MDYTPKILDVYEVIQGRGIQKTKVSSETYADNLHYHESLSEARKQIRQKPRVSLTELIALKRRAYLREAFESVKVRYGYGIGRRGETYKDPFVAMGWERVKRSFKL